MPWDTRALTGAMAAGDPAAIAAFYRAEFDFLLSTARQASGKDEAFCLDVVQDAVLKIVRTIRPVDHPAALRAWLKLVVQSTAYDQLRAAKRRQKHEALAMANSVAAAAGEESEPDQSHWLARQLNQLDPELVRLIDLRYQQQWTLAKIAAATGLSAGTIDGRLRRALSRMRKDHDR